MTSPLVLGSVRTFRLFPLEQFTHISFPSSAEARTGTIKARTITRITAILIILFILFPSFQCLYQAAPSFLQPGRLCQAPVNTHDRKEMAVGAAAFYFPAVKAIFDID
jgi:hypothetical protein